MIKKPYAPRNGNQLWRMLLIAMLAVIAIFSISGCQGGSGAKPLNSTALKSLGKEMVLIEGKNAAELESSLQDSKDKLKPIKNPSARARFTFLRGYMQETLQATKIDDQRDYADAYQLYHDAAAYDSAYVAQARFRMGLLAANELVAGSDINKDKPQTSPMSEAKRNLQLLAHRQGGLFGAKPDIIIWVRQPELAGMGGKAEVVTNNVDLPKGKPIFMALDAPTVVTARLDTIYQTAGGLDQTYHKLVAAYVKVFRSFAHGYGPALALIFLALLIKLVTMPLTAASYRGMRDMQKVQPLLKELQEKYKDDKAKLAQEQMLLMKEHKVSPMGGCLPMLIQLPIFWVVYRAVMVYAEGFANAHFLWINNLASPDSILLILYAISMIVTQKLTTMPTSDPAMMQQQKLMTYMLPIMLLFMLSSLASAFVLYWFFLNVFSAAHQYYMMNQMNAKEAALAIIDAPVISKKKGK